jgi:ribose transport system permease protein
MKGVDIFKNLLKRFGSILGLIILCISFSILSPYFLTARNWSMILQQVSVLAIIALGELLVILTAGIDLSVGSLLALSMVVMAKAEVEYGVNPFLALFIGILVGLGFGLSNGLLYTKLHLPHPFISTLGMMMIARGLALMLTDGYPISGLSPTVCFLGTGQLGPIPMPLVCIIVCYLAFHIFLTQTVLGRKIYAIGGNREAAKLSGINVSRALTIVYCIAGFTFALGGILLAGRVNSAFPLAGQGYELDAIAAVIIGGASFFGGKGSVGGTLIGVLIIGVLRNGLNLLNVSPFAQMSIMGAVIIIAVYVDVLRRKAF